MAVSPDVAKQELRARMRAARAAIPSNERARLALQVEERLFSLPEVQAARTVLLFYSFGSEVPTAGMAERLLGSGGRLLLPYLAKGRMRAAEVHSADDLVESGYGPKEPARRVAVRPDQVDLVVTPGLAFDRRGHRLGYGGGHYDRFLARLHPDALRVGIGFGLQLLDEIPAGALDERVHMVVTERETVDCR